MLEKLIIVRHGDYHGDSGLTFGGQQQIVGLAKVLADHVGSSTIALLSSTAPRAKETSEILASHFGGIQFDSHMCLYSGGRRLVEENAEKALQLIDDKGATHTVVILSTHLEFIDFFPTFWGRKRGFEIPESRETPKGTARVINVQTGEVEYLFPENL